MIQFRWLAEFWTRLYATPQKMLWSQLKTFLMFAGLGTNFVWSIDEELRSKNFENIFHVRLPNQSKTSSTNKNFLIVFIWNFQHAFCSWEKNSFEFKNQFFRKLIILTSNTFLTRYYCFHRWIWITNYYNFGSALQGNCNDYFMFYTN